MRLFSLIGGTWQSNDYTYTATTTATGAGAGDDTGAELDLDGVDGDLPVDGRDGGLGVPVDVGTTVGGQDLFSQRRLGPLERDRGGPADQRQHGVCAAVLVDGRDLAIQRLHLHARRLTTAPAQITTPAPGSTLTASTVTFQWTGGTGVSDYWLTVGTTVGGQTSLARNGTSLSATVAGLPTNGSTLYVRLYSLIGGTWLSNDYTYTATTTTRGGWRRLRHQRRARP